MLQNIRKNIQGMVAKVIVALIVIPFALFGIESLTGGGGVQNVAEVNGEPISAIDLQEQINRQKRRLMMSLGDNIDPGMLDDQVLAGPALDLMVEKILLLQEAEDYGLAVSDQRLNEMITEMPAFHSEAQFDPQLYRQLLSEQGYTPRGFRKALRDDLLMTQLRTGLSGGEFVTPSELALMATISEEKRDLRYLFVPIARFKDATTVSTEDEEQWYQTNIDSYKTKEVVDLDYIELQLADFVSEIQKSEVQALYELEKEAMVVPEIRAVSHILFEQGSDESDQALQTRMADVAAQISAGADNFADVAKQHSQDLGSANFGGELGLTSGDTFPAEIEAAVATLAQNQVSAPVKSDAGWHLLLVTDIREGDAPSFDEVRMELEQRLSSERAKRELVSTTESLRDLVFNAEDLTGPASELSLTVSRISAVSRSDGEGIFSDKRVTTAAFSQELLAEGYNSEVIELNEDHFVVVRVARHYPAEILPLDSVREQVVSEILESQARDKAAAYAGSLLAELEQGKSIEEIALAGGYDWQVELGATRDNRSVPSSTLQRIFQLEVPTDGSSFDYVQTFDGDIEVFELFRVSSGNIEKISEARVQSLEQSMATQTERSLDDAYQTTLGSRAEVVRS